jgi:hypothetical protein
MPVARRGRPARFSEYDQLEASLPPALGKRPRYLNGIGVSRGSRGLTAWLKLRLPHGGFLKGKTYAPNASVEIKVGSLNSWSWERLVAKYDELQGRADRGDPLEDAPDTAFAGYAHEWLVRAQGRIRKNSSDDMAIRKHLIPAFGKLGLRQISTAEINRWLAKRRLTAKPGTVQREFNTLRAILNDAVRSGLIEKSPTQSADPIRGAVPPSDAPSVRICALVSAIDRDTKPPSAASSVSGDATAEELSRLCWDDSLQLQQNRPSPEHRLPPAYFLPDIPSVPRRATHITRLLHSCRCASAYLEIANQLFGFNSQISRRARNPPY